MAKDPLLRVFTAVVYAALILAPLASAQGIRVSKFVSGNANLTLTDKTSTGRNVAVALSSPDGSYELVLIQDGFGTSTNFQYCWTEVHDTFTGQNLTWRAPCNPIKVDQCSLLLSSDGDFRLAVSVKGVKAFPFRSETGGEGLVDVQLTNGGDLLLVKADNTSVWRSSDHIQKQQKCREAFTNSSAPHLRTPSFVFLTCTILVSCAVVFF